MNKLKTCLLLLAMLAVPTLAGETTSSKAVLVPVIGESWTRDAKKAIRAVGTNALPSLLSLASSRGETEATCRQLARAGFEALGSDAAPAVPALTGLLDDPSPQVRSVAVRCLEAVGPVASNAVPRLIRALGDSDAEVRRSALAALVKIPGNASLVVPSLISHLDGPHPDHSWGMFDRLAAVAALGRYASESATAVAALRRMTNDASLLVRLKASAQLNAVEHPQPRPAAGD